MLQPLDLRVGDSLERALEETADRSFGGTDCVQPMAYALEKGLKASLGILQLQ